MIQRAWVPTIQLKINLLVPVTLTFEPSLYTPGTIGPRRRRSRRRQPAHPWHRVLRDVI
jgi:hypothetical protein